MGITDKIYKLLEEVKNVYYGWYREDINDTHVTFYVYNEVPDNFSDDEFECIGYYIQFDVWGTNEEETLQTKNKVRKILINNNFSWQESNDDFETDTELYHRAMRFYFVEEVEE